MEPADRTDPLPDAESDAEPWADDPEDADDAVAETEAAYPVFVNVLGSDLRLDCSQPETGAAVARAWSWCLVERQAVEPACVIDVPDDAAPLGEDALAAVTLRICLAASMRLDPSWLLLEAFGVADAEGRVALVVGRGVRERVAALLHLCRGDLSYVGTDLVAIAPDGAVLACPKPVVLPKGSDGEPRATSRGPDALGLRRPVASLSVARIVLLEPREDGPEPPDIEGAPLTDALAALAPLVAAWRAPENPLQELARLVDRCGGAHVMVYRQGADVADSLRAVLGAPAAGTEDWAVVTDRPANAMAWGLRDGRVRQKPVVDAIASDGEVMVLVDRAPMRLGPLGATIWRRSISGATDDDLEAAAVAEHGPHPQAGDLVRAGVVELSTAGVVARGAPLTVARVLAGDLRDAPS